MPCPRRRRFPLGCGCRRPPQRRRHPVSSRQEGGELRVRGRLGPKGQRDRRKLRLVVIIGALLSFAPLSLDMYLPALPSLARSLGGTAWEIQLTLTACLLGLATGQLIAGPLSDRTGRRRPLLIGVGAYAAASWACTLAPSLPVLITLRLIQGASGAAGIVIARAVMRDLFEGPELARFLGLAMAVNGLAPILAPMIGGQIIRFGSWRLVFVVLGCIGLALLVAAALGLPETHVRLQRAQGGVRPALRTFRSLVADRRFSGYGLSCGLAYAAMFAYIGGSPFVIEDRFGVAPQVFSAIFAGNACGIMLLSQTSARLVRRYGARRLLQVGLGMSLTGALLLVVVAASRVGLVGILPGFLLTVASIGLINPNATALALGEHAAEAGSASALLGMAQVILGGVAAPLSGLGGRVAELPMVLTMATASAGATASYLLLVVRRRPPASAAMASTT